MRTRNLNKMGDGEMSISDATATLVITPPSCYASYGLNVWNSNGLFATPDFGFLAHTFATGVIPGIHYWRR